MCKGNQCENYACANPDIIPPMNIKRVIFFVILISLFVVGVSLPAKRATALQQIVTPTAGPDGRIIYIVVPGDNCFVVAAKNSITQEQLRAFNTKLDKDCTISIGQELLIGLVGPAAGTPTPGASPTPLPPTLTPTPFVGTTEVCILLFNDINGNSLREDTELAIEGGAISVTENNGKFSQTQNTVINSDPDAYQGICFSDVPEGNYTVSAAIPDGYNPTIDTSYRLDVLEGQSAFVDFGAQSKETTVTTTSDENAGKSPFLGFIGLLFLLGGAGLGYYAWRSGRPESKLSGGGMLRK